MADRSVFSDNYRHFLNEDEVFNVFDEYITTENEELSDSDSEEERGEEEEQERVTVTFDENNQDYGELQDCLRERENERREQLLSTFLHAAEGDSGESGESSVNHHHLCKCSCKHGPEDSRCIEQFSTEQITNCRCASSELDSAQLDAMVLAKIEAGFHAEERTITSKRKTNSLRKKSRTDYRHLGKIICKSSFCYLHCIGESKLDILAKHYSSTKSVVPRKLNQGSKLKISYEQSCNFSTFMTNFLEQHSLVLPGRISGITRQATEVLPSSYTKAFIYHHYSESHNQQTEVKPISFSSFTRLWKLLFPTVSICKPMTDLCWTCQRNNTIIYQ